MMTEQHKALSAVEIERGRAILEFLADSHNQDGAHAVLLRGYLDGQPVGLLALNDCQTGTTHIAAIFVDGALSSRLETAFGPLEAFEEPIVIDPTLN